MKSELELLLEQNHIDINSEEFQMKFAKIFKEKLKENIRNMDVSQLDDAVSVLLKVGFAESNEEKLSYIHRALELDPDCLGAKLMLAEFKETAFEAVNYLEEVLEDAKGRLIKEGYFKKQNIGHFMEHLDTSSYISGLYALMFLYRDLNGYKRAIYLGEEMKRLDDTDHKHVHFDLLGLYAQVEDDQKINKMCKNCNDKCILYFIVMMVLYFKKGNFRKAKEYLEEVMKINPYFVSYFDNNNDKPASKEENEIFRIVDNYCYLFENDFLKEFIVKKGNV